MSWFRRWALACFLAGAGACGAAAYRLDDAPRVTTAVAIDAPEGCALQRTLLTALGDHMGTVTFRASTDAQVRMAVRLQRSAAGWLASIRTTSAEGGVLGVRELALPGDTCAEAREGLAFVVELVADTPEVAAAVEAAQEEAPAPTREVYLSALGAATLGRSPSPGGIVGVEALVAWRPFELRIAALGLLPGTEAASERVRLAGGELALEACPALTRGLARLAFCGGLRPGFLRAEGLGFSNNRSTFGAHLDGTLAFRPSIRWRRLLVGLGLEFGVALVRPQFAFVQGGEAQVFFEPSRVWGALRISVGFRL